VEAANHCSTIPLQASMARTVTDRPRPAAGAGAGAGCSALAAEQAAFAAQQDAAFSGRGSGRSVAARASAARTEASHPLARAQASRSAGEWQQQFVKHCSADAQPHGLFMHGKGRERSLAARSRAAAGSIPASPRSAGRLPKGSGSPNAMTA
jgi:hypothetical protein